MKQAYFMLLVYLSLDKMKVRVKGSVMWEDTGISENKFLWGREKDLIVARRKPQMALLSGKCVT